MSQTDLSSQGRFHRVAVAHLSSDGRARLAALLVASAISIDIPITRANLAFEEERFRGAPRHCGRELDSSAHRSPRCHNARHVPLVFIILNAR